MNQTKTFIYQFEVYGKQNPIVIPINFGRPLNIELDSYYFKPTTAPTADKEVITVKVNSVKRKFNLYGREINVLESIPFDGTKYLYNRGIENEALDLGSGDTEVSLRFVYKKPDDNNLNDSLIVFDNNYLLNFRVSVQHS